MCGWKGILIEPITRLYTLLDFVVHAKWMLFTRSSTVSTSHWANGKKVNEKRAVQWNLMMFSISFPAIEIQWPNSSVGALPKISSPIKIFVEISFVRLYSSMVKRKLFALRCKDRDSWFLFQASILNSLTSTYWPESGANDIHNYNLYRTKNN